MTTYTHTELLAAITESRKQAFDCPECVHKDWHLDTLQALLDRHPARIEKRLSRPHFVAVCDGEHDLSDYDSYPDWPCGDADIAITALRKMGALE